MTIDELLWLMSKIGASDLHLKVGSRPALRKDGRLHHVDTTSPLKPEDTRALAYSMMSDEQQRAFEKEHDLDLGYSVSGLARFRVNIFQQRGSISIVMRQIPTQVPRLEDLGLPPACEKLALRTKGLVLVTGPGGSGKSTTLAAMLQHINENRAAHILTLEHPVEFLHRDMQSLVNQREVGSDTKSFVEGLRRAMREDPDVILVGELPDTETISLTLKMAETGHLILATLHATSALNTVERILGAFPSEQQHQVRLQLAVTLEGVISQILLPRTGGGMAPACEIMLVNAAVRSAIREGKTDQLRNLLQRGEKEGMHSLEKSLAALVKDNKVALEDALARANLPDTLQTLLRGGEHVPLVELPTASVW